MLTMACDSDVRTVHGHFDCLGYVAPLAYGADRPCACPCHEDGRNPRDWERAYRRAHASYYGPVPEP